MIFVSKPPKPVSGFLHTMLLALVLVFTSAPAARATPQNIIEAEEYEVKAVYLYNFILFVTWPKKNISASDSFTIGIIGEDPFGRSFRDVEGKPIKNTGKKLAIKRFGPYRDGLDLEACHVLFIAASEQPRFKQIISRIGTAPVLTISDTDTFLDAGGMINLVKSGSKIRWEINRPALAAAPLRLNSQLYRSAVNIKE
ncbi:MAG: YfiR family protein [Deltaproteobacteria bacterium]|nr:YfiR family protein [Deltaproteobacteria bacterium]